MPRITRSRKPMASKAAENIPVKASSAAAIKHPPTPMKRSRPESEDKENEAVPLSKKQRVVAFASPSKPVPIAANTKAKGGSTKTKGKATPKPCIKPSRTSVDLNSANELSNAQPPELNAQWNVEGHYNITSISPIDHSDTTAFSLKLFYWSVSEPRYLYAAFIFDKLEGIMKLSPSEPPRRVRYDQMSAGSNFEQIHDLDPTERPGPDCRNWSMRWRGQEGDMFEGEELDCQRLLKFSHEPSSAAAGSFMPMDIKFTMTYHGKVRVFEASKECAQPPWALEQKWAELDRTRAPEKKTIADHPPPSKAAPKNVKRGKEETAKGTGAGAKGTSMPWQKKAQKNQQTQQWNVEGSYKVTQAAVIDDYGKPANYVDVHGFELSIFYWSGSYDHQLYATFGFDNLEGIMRFYPKHLGHIGETFENYCKLSSTEKPGPEKTQFKMRWRAMQMSSDERVGGDAKGIFEFDNDFESLISDADPGDFMPMEISFTIVYNGEDTMFIAEKTGDLLHGQVADRPSKLAQEWASLRPKGESQAAKPRCRGQQTQKVEEVPNWAYAVRGSYRGTKASHVFDVEAEDIRLDIKIANNAAHAKVKRQIWAEVCFGYDIKGIMRLCPYSGPKPLTLKEFESACVLEEGCWPGPAPHGQREWLMRWRGADVDEDEYDEWHNQKHDNNQTEFKFEIGDDGGIKISAVMMPSGGFGGVPGIFEAVKVGGEPKTASDSGLAAMWKKYRYEQGGGQRVICSAGSVYW